MQRMTEQIMAQAERLPEGAPISAKRFLHLGSRAAVDQALSRLRRRGQLLHAGRGLYLRPVGSRFGVRPPAVETLVDALAAHTGEVVVESGAASANKLGLTTQVPVQHVYFTSGPSRSLRLGRQTVELKHVPRWQLALGARPAGEAVRALAWMGPEQAEAGASVLRRKLAPVEFAALAAAAPQMPAWLARSVTAAAAHG